MKVHQGAARVKSSRQGAQMGHLSEGEADTLITREDVTLESAHDENDLLKLRRGHTVQRTQESGKTERGLVGLITNWHWGNITWVRDNGTVYTKKEYLPSVKLVKVKVMTLKRDASGPVPCKAGAAGARAA